MPEGRVIDPDGQQSSPKEWGYIIRGDLFWPPPDDDQKKVIPFKNKPDSNGQRPFKKNNIVTFVVAEKMYGGRLMGVAVDVVKIRDK